MKELSNFFPANIKYDIPYDITPVVEASIQKVLMTLVGGRRAGVSGDAAVPAEHPLHAHPDHRGAGGAARHLRGRCWSWGSPSTCSRMFGMVLAIGILVDDAIVVVENVERIMSEEGLSPKEATRKAMGQITGAIIGITLVLISVFIPMAFFPGSVGIIYKQFSVTMVAAIGFSALLALSLTPALCATLLKPVEAGHHHAKRGLFGWFNRRMESSAQTAIAVWSRWSLPRTGRSDADLRRRWSARWAGRFVAPAGRLPAGRRSGLHHRPTCRRRRRPRSTARSTPSRRSRNICCSARASRT